MKWNNKKKSEAPKSTAAREKLVSKTVLDDLLAQISGGAASQLASCHSST